MKSAYAMVALLAVAGCGGSPKTAAVPTPQRSADITGCAVALAIAQRDTSLQTSLLNGGTNAELLASRSELARDLHQIGAENSAIVREAVAELATKFAAAVAYSSDHSDEYSYLSPITSTNILDAGKRVASVCRSVANETP